jgi:hypothetical protein
MLERDVRWIVLGALAELLTILVLRRILAARVSRIHGVRGVKLFGPALQQVLDGGT